MLKRFLLSESGAVTTDYVVMSAGVVGVGLAVLNTTTMGVENLAGDIDTALITLHYANGAIGTIDNSRRAVYGYDQRVEAFGSAGMAASDNHVDHSTVVRSM